MIFEIKCRINEQEVAKRCSVPGIIPIPAEMMIEPGSQWIIATRREEWWILGARGLRGPFQDAAGFSNLKISWGGPCIMMRDCTEVEPVHSVNPAGRPCVISIDHTHHEFSKPVVIGRKSLCGIRVRSATVSGLHALLCPTEKSILYFDLATSNGSYDSRGARISATKLIRGDTVTMGDTVVKVAATAHEQTRSGFKLESTVMKNLEELISKVAPSNAPVVITGESGVGKELVANAIHRHSRVDGAMITANASCFTPQLARSELFGHVAGAFTDASYNRQGLFSAAHKGTLFLDEVAEMSLSVQAELLRAIETGLIHPLGASEPVIARPRIIVASHKPLDAEVSAGRFRQDLYYRLCVVQLSVPSLRDRPEDIDTLAKAFVERYCPGSKLSPDALQWLRIQPWSGNVRELRNLFWKASVIYPERPTDIFNLKHLLNGGQASRVMPDDVVRVFFEQNQDIQKTARALGVHRSTVHRHIREYRNGMKEAA
jgi:transcriptional regulator of acetoin/glycerol metabolism